MSRSTVIAIASIVGLTLTPTLPAVAQGSAPRSTSGAQHGGHSHEKPAATSPPATPASEGGTRDHTSSDKAPADLPAFIPPLTDEDRQAAFPDLRGHTVHDNGVNYFVLFDQLEWQGAEGGGLNVDSKGWIGRDRNRLWFRAEGEGEGGDVANAQAHVLYGHQFSRWWDVVAGIRQDFRPGPTQSWAAFGVQGLAPYWFEVEATAYIGESGRTHARFEVEYELLLTNRLVLQPLVEMELFGKSDPERGIGAGLSTMETGARLRYEFKREIAPYIGITWNRKFGKTADFAEAAGEDISAARVVAGLRLWF